MSLFEGHRFLIIQSSELSATKAEYLKKQIIGTGYNEEGGILLKRNSDLIPISNEKLVNVTLIVSNTVDFVEYQLAEELMIPVVRDAWVVDSIAANLIETLRMYSPDPKYFLSSVSICCAASICKGDKEALFSAVRSFGGIHTDHLSRRTTHLIAVDTDDDICRMAIAFNQACERKAIAIVRPEWLLDSIISKRKLAEDRYGVGSKERYAEPMTSALFRGRTFFLDDDFNISSRVSSSLKTLIEQHGGKVDSEDRANTYIGKYRAGDMYQLANEEKWPTGNLNWLFWMLLHEEWIPPGKIMLHYPYPREPLEGMDRVVVSVTHYSGDSRLYLQQLVEIMGGTFTKNLRQFTTTHLLVAKPTGEKYKYAQEWNIKCLNHLWLEESYAKWELQDETDPRYLRLGDQVDVAHAVGHTSLEIGLPSSQNTRMDSQEVPGSLEMPRKRLKPNSKPYDIVAILTGCDKELSASDLRNLSKVGIKIVEQPTNSLNCIIAPGILRTEKFLKSLSKSPQYLLTPTFLIDVLATINSHKLDNFERVKPSTDRYDLSRHINFKKDSKMKELFLDPSLGAQNIVNLIENSNCKLFESGDFCVSATIPGGPDLISSIVRSFGCQVCLTVDKKTKRLPKRVAATRYLLCEAKDEPLQNHFRKLAEGEHYRIVEWNWVVMSIFNTKLVDRFIIDES
ncbi:hypothetical protein KL949_002489 [Ogataea haglerorum]|nr:hypothetical protein KL913_004166 [Ogataea haglerorum]KAG7719497.1 hypothetical protein KL949_002489 [Ogataea haglerorum]